MGVTALSALNCSWVKIGYFPLKFCTEYFLCSLNTVSNKCPLCSFMCHHRIWPLYSGIFSDSHLYSCVAAIRAAVLIQQWYRQYVARTEMRRRYTWHIFQSIEYSGEQAQIKVRQYWI